MNISLYLEPQLLKALESKAKEDGKKRNAAIREAVEHWLKGSAAESLTDWPDVLNGYEYAGTFPRFEAHRSELMTLAEAEVKGGFA